MSIGTTAHADQREAGPLAERSAATLIIEGVARFTHSRAASGLVADAELRRTHPTTLGTVVAVEAEIDADAGANLKAGPADARPVAALFTGTAGSPARPTSSRIATQGAARGAASHLPRLALRDAATANAHLPLSATALAARLLPVRAATPPVLAFGATATASFLERVRLAFLAGSQAPRLGLTIFSLPEEHPEASGNAEPRHRAAREDFGEDLGQFIKSVVIHRNLRAACRGDAREIVRAGTTRRVPAPVASPTKPTSDTPGDG